VLKHAGYFSFADTDLILTMLAEATTIKLSRDRDSVGMAPLKKDAKDGVVPQIRPIG
jgi:hypothetical protein